MSLRDVVILGGGPTGATLAALLAGQGLDVLVVERDPFPRFHVGESLLPSCMPVLERLGVDLSRGPFLRKAGAEFVDESRPPGEQTVTFRFSEGLPGTIDHAYQVERALFDRVLLERARALGAEVREGVQVLDWHDEPDGPRLVTTQGEVRARFGLDASGQVAFLARRRRTMAPYRDFGRAAAFFHFGPLAPDAVAELAVEGNVKVFVSPQGWGWAIPLQDGKLSVGVVGNQGGFSPATLRALVRGSPLLQRLTAGAKCTAPRMIGDFSFQNTRPYGPRWACVGDACCFLDPVFSSGVSLGLTAAVSLVELLAPALREGREGEPELLAPWRAHMDRAYRTFAQLIWRFYHTHMVQNLFFGPQPLDHPMRRGIVTVLAGEVWREDNPFQDALLKPARHGAVEPATLTA